MSVDITEFVEIDPDSVHAVYKAANGTPFLMVKQVSDGEKPADGSDDDEDDKPGDAKKSSFDFCGDVACEVCLSRASKGRLTMGERRQIPKSDYALPEKAPEHGSYPIKDKAHARAALRLRGHASPEDQARIKRAVAAKYPDLGKGKKEKKAAKEMGSQRTVEQSFHGMLPSPDAQQGQTKKNKRGLATNKDVQRAAGKATLPDAGSPPQMDTGFGRTAAAQGSTATDTQGAERQTEQERRASASKETPVHPDGMNHDMHEGRGDANPEDVPVVTDTATGSLQSQTQINTRAKKTGSDAVRDQMTRQSEQAQKKSGFKFKVKKTGKKKRKKNAPHVLTGALKQDGPERVLSVANATKELDDMTGAEFAQTLIETLDARDARKAEERKAKKAKAKKKAKKAKKAGATKPVGNEEAAQEAAKSISPEKLVEGIGARVEAALKEAVAPLWGRMQNLENQPARSRPALNNLAGTQSITRDQKNPGGNPMDVFKPLEDAFKSEKDPYKREKIGSELTKAKLVTAERIRHGHSVSPEEARQLVPSAVV
jgi:hypothetical protein